MLPVLILLLSLLWAAPSWASVTASSSNFAYQSSTATTSACVMPTDVPSGATVVVAEINRTDYNTAVSSVADPVNGAYTAGDADARIGSSSSSAGWYYKTNSAALTGSTNRTVTVTWAGSVNHVVVCGWLSSSLGAMTFDAKATSNNVSSATTSLTSNALSYSAGTGVAICLAEWGTYSAAAPSMTGGETFLSSYDSGSQGWVAVAYLTFSGSGSHTCTTTVNNSTQYIYGAVSFIEPASGFNFFPRRLQVNP